MDLRFHFITSGLLVLALYPFFGIYSLLIFITGFLIDFDHYIYYVVKYKDANPMNAYQYIMTNKGKNIIRGFLCIFHTLEFFILMIILSLFSFTARILLYGLIMHYSLDAIDTIINKKGNERAYSIILKIKEILF